MTARVYALRDAAAFRSQNNENWAAITDFWLSAPLAHVGHIGEHLVRLILAAHHHATSILDMGCGNAWLHQRLRNAGWNGHYIGVDNNALLIERLRQQSTDTHAEFHCEDVESAPRTKLPPVDIVVNAFNFFELPDLEGGFRWAAARLGSGGTLIVATIEPLAQLLAICETRDELDRALALWSAPDSLVAYDKTVDVEGRIAIKTYSGVLYGLSDYVRHAQQVNLRLTRLEEIRKTARRPPQVYELIEFHDTL